MELLTGQLIEGYGQTEKRRLEALRSIVLYRQAIRELLDTRKVFNQEHYMPTNYRGAIIRNALDGERRTSRSKEDQNSNRNLGEKTPCKVTEQELTATRLK